MNLQFVNLFFLKAKRHAWMKHAIISITDIKYLIIGKLKFIIQKIEKIQNFNGLIKTTKCIRNVLTDVTTKKNNYLVEARKLLNEPIIWTTHSSPQYIKLVALSIILYNIFFHKILIAYLPETFAITFIRIIICTATLLIIYKSSAISNGIQFWQRFYNLVIFIQLPVLSLFLAYLNFYNAISLSVCIGTLFVYYLFTDWRIAFSGICVSIVIAIILHLINFPTSIKNVGFGINILNIKNSNNNLSNLNIFISVFICFWLISTMIFIYHSYVLRSIQKNNLENIAIRIELMGQQLRTPIASISILSYLLKKQAYEHNNHQLDDYSKKLNRIVKTINQNITDQIINTKPILGTELINSCSALFVVESAIANYPFSTETEKNIVQIVWKSNFHFVANQSLYTQVINNLIKNAIQAMRVIELLESEMRLTILLDVAVINKKNVGLITIKDNGLGMSKKDLIHIKNTYVNANSLLRHGLGLPFCKSVLRQNGGILQINSTANIGTSVRLIIPTI